VDFYRRFTLCRPDRKIFMDRLPILPTLGVGVLYNPSLAEFLRTECDTIDFLEITPDMFWTDRGPGSQPQYEELESWVEFLDWIAERRPVVAHNIGLSIGNAGRFDLNYIQHIASWNDRYHFPWHSDHLSFADVTGADGHIRNAGSALPVAYDYEALEMLVERVNQVQEIVPIPFLLENNVYFITFPEQEMSEPQFLNELTARTGCGLLLDIHNLYANARNHHFDAIQFLDELNLMKVVETHIAGGSEFAGMYTDSHSGACPQPVWDLLDYVVPRAPNLRAVTFEFHDSYYPFLGAEGLREQLSRARSIFTSHREVVLDTKSISARSI
jgi:uncharacterized protein (UPF0276 family)